MAEGILPVLAVVCPPPIEFDDLHAAIWTGGGDVVFKESAQGGFDGLGVGVGEAGLLSELAVDAAEGGIKPEADAVLHAHGVTGLS